MIVLKAKTFPIGPDSLGWVIEIENHNLRDFSVDGSRISIFPAQYPGPTTSFIVLHLKVEVTTLYPFKVLQ